MNKSILNTTAGTKKRFGEIYEGRKNDELKDLVEIQYANNKWAIKCFH